MLDARSPAGKLASPWPDVILHADIMAENFTTPAVVITRQPENIQSAVAEFQRLVEARTVGLNLSKIASIPMNYTPSSGKGASRWTYAKLIYESNKVGADAVLPLYGSDPGVARNQVWGNLADATLSVIRFAQSVLPEWKSLMGRAVAVFPVEKKRKGGSKLVSGAFYLLDDGATLYWPDWFALCENLPTRISNNEAQYLQAARSVIDEFFADPDNPDADELVKPMMARGVSRPQAVNEIRNRVLKVISRAR